MDFLEIQEKHIFDYWLFSPFRVDRFQTTAHHSEKHSSSGHWVRKKGKPTHSPSRR